jgi:hypothetical protein
VPRDWLAPLPAGATHRPQRFGRRHEPQWKTPTTDHDRALLAAAKNQHQLAIRVHIYRDRIGATTEDIAAAIGRSPDHLRKILRGAAHVTLTDLHLIADAIDCRVEATIKVGRNAP